jgi:hypothetical protein
LPLVAPVRLDQPHERLARHCEGTDGRSEPLHDRVLGLAVVRAVELALEPVELRETVAFDLVAQLVDESREAVDREQVVARRSAEQERRDREVLGRRTLEDSRLARHGIGGDAHRPIVAGAARPRQAGIAQRSVNPLSTARELASGA